MAENDCKAYVYSFKKGVKQEEIEFLILWALRSAEFYYNKSQVLLEFSYLIKGSKCIIKGGSEVSGYIVRIFTELLIQKIGKDKFKLERVIEKEAPDINKAQKIT